ncbi:type II secretion system protein [Paenibacillus albiflavus]|uniref:Type II secretion system protein n=1 Tax=Paenibacillus albiflavus TaxID=2545760 RepID=A0A4R4ERG0_9BACL|nr:type II secretion system F family protein [Paenibacillus albiflavus]TCZ81018.1 type II secretion system protein [Paenibacillus albiflavus]
MILLKILLAVEVGLCFLFMLLSLRLRKELNIGNELPYKYKLKFLAPVSLYVLNVFQIMRRIDFYTIKVHQKVITIYGNKHAREITQWFIAETLTLITLCVVGGTLFTVLADDPTIFGFGLFIAILIPVLVLRQLSNEVEQRKRSIIRELPEVLNKIILLVNAGETVQGALIRTINQGNNTEETPLFKEMKLTIQELQMNISFAKALENMSRRCASQEVTMFTTTLLLNYKRGGDELVLSLRTLSKELWDRRKAVSRTAGEEAASKLVIPMVVIFLVVLIIVGAPALMMM